MFCFAVGCARAVGGVDLDWRVQCCFFHNRLTPPTMSLPLFLTIMPHPASPPPHFLHPPISLVLLVFPCFGDLCPRSA